MKIAFDHQTFNLQCYGGISRYYTVLAQELLNQGEDVGIFAGIHQNNYLSNLPKDILRGVKIKGYPPKSGRVFRAFNHYFTNMQISSWQPDIVHETYYSSMPLFKATTPRVTTVYDMIHELYPKMFSVRDKTTDWKRATFDRVEHIISISESTKKDLIELFRIDEDRISVVHLGVDAKFYHDYSGLKNESKRPFLLYVGARGGYKNFNALLQALSNSTQLKKDFDLIAFGGGAFSRKELDLMSGLGLDAKCIRQVGGRDDKLKELYHLASGFIYPSLYEGFGMPPLEAMACLCPVISSNSSSMPEVVGDAGEYFDPTNIDELLSAIENVVYSTIRSEQLQLLGKERVEYFSWEETAKNTFNVYQNIVG